MLQLLSLLQTRRFWSGAELAERMEVTPRTLRRDIERLRDLGYPVDADRGIGGGYRLAAGAALPPLVLDDAEAIAIAVGLQSAAQGSVAGIEQSALQALTKVVQVMPPRLRQRVDAVRAMTVPATWGPRTAGPAVEADTLTAIAQACRDDERLRFDYRTADGRTAQRHVEPHRLVSLGGRWYLVAYDLGRHDWRSFRLDRLRAPSGTGARFRPRPLPAEDAAAFVREGIESASSRYAVDVIIHAPVARVRAALDGWGAIEDIDGQRSRLRMTTDTLDWPAMALGAVEADFEIVSPPELGARIAEWGERFTRAAG